MFGEPAREAYNPTHGGKLSGEDAGPSAVKELPEQKQRKGRRRPAGLGVVGLLDEASGLGFGPFVSSPVSSSQENVCVYAIAACRTAPCPSPTPRTEYHQAPFPLPES